MSRRLLGYVVKLPDGTRSPHTRVPVGHTTSHDIATHDCPVGSYVVPVFAVRKPKPADAPTGRSVPQWFGVKRPQADVAASEQVARTVKNVLITARGIIATPGRYTTKGDAQTKGGKIVCAYDDDAVSFGLFGAVSKANIRFGDNSQVAGRATGLLGAYIPTKMYGGVAQVYDWGAVSQEDAVKIFDKAIQKLESST